VAAGLGGVGIHTLAMLTVTAAIAATVYEWVGVEILRRAWMNADFDLDAGTPDNRGAARAGLDKAGGPPRTPFAVTEGILHPVRTPNPSAARGGKHLSQFAPSRTRGAVPASRYNAAR
jgi:hypothetical protein